MKISFIFLLVAILISLPTITAYNFTDKALSINNEASMFIGRVIRDWNRRHFITVTKDVAILNLSNDSLLLESVLRSIPLKNPVLLPERNCLDKKKYSKSRESDFLIIIIGNQSQSQITNGIFGCIDTPFWSSTSNVVFLTTKKDQSNITKTYLFSIAVRTRSINSVIVSINDNKIDKIIKCNIFHNTIEVLNLTHNTDVLFDDKLRDMDGYLYSTIIISNHERLDRLQSSTQKLKNRLIQTIASTQNAKLKITEQLATADNLSGIHKNLSQGIVDMLLNLGYPNGFKNVNQNFKSVNIYETDGYCALISIPPKLPFIILTIGIFDKYTRLLLIGFVLLGALIWRIFAVKSKNKTESAVNFSIKVVCIFFGHFSPFRKNRLILRIMLQCYAFSFMIIGNVYESCMFSILMDQGRYTKITNIEGITNGDYQINILKESDYIWQLNKTLQDKTLDRPSKDIDLYNKLINHEYNKVLIVKCEDLKDFMQLQIDPTTKVEDIYYQLSKKLLVYYDNFLLSRRSPFLDKLSQISLKIHESGIKQHWKLLMEESKSTQKDDIQDENVLTMNQVLGAFKIYFIVLGLALATFVMEILWFHVMNCWHWIIRKFRQKSKSLNSRRVDKPKVKMIMVQPKLEEDII
ncbi:hypothetical protein ACKWTF_000534 [Chironomus riparius]